MLEVIFSICWAFWRNLADINADGKMDQLEFSIAIHLVRKKLQGATLPKVLPSSMKVDPGKAGSVTTSPVRKVPQQQASATAAAKASATSPQKTAKDVTSATVCSPPLSKPLSLCNGQCVCTDHFYVGVFLLHLSCVVSFVFDDH